MLSKIVHPSSCDGCELALPWINAPPCAGIASYALLLWGGGWRRNYCDCAIHLSCPYPSLPVWVRFA